MQPQLREDALQIFGAALKAANAADAVKRHLLRTGDELRAGEACYRLPKGRRVSLIAVGKAAAAMAAAVEASVGDRLARGVVVTKAGHAAAYRGLCEVIEAGHPVPDAESVRAGNSVLSLLASLTPDDLLIVAVSGGASALLCAPAGGITLDAKRATTDLLLRAGAEIHEFNCVRKHLSMLKGGQLVARAGSAEVLGLLLSDVIGDPLDVIGSGLTAPDPSTFAEALAICERRGVLATIPAEVRRHLERGEAETPKPGAAAFERTTNVLVGSNRQALDAASKEAVRCGYQTLILSSSVQGESREAAHSHVKQLFEILRSGELRAPVCLLSGGETTVTLRGHGRGGRNQEFALAAAIALAGATDVVALSAGTDGTDGPTDAAGAIVSGETISRAQALCLDAAGFLNDNDSYTFFDRLGDLVKTGPTGTNVMDINILLGYVTSDNAYYV